MTSAGLCSAPASMRLAIAQLRRSASAMITSVTSSLSPVCLSDTSIPPQVAVLSVPLMSPLRILICLF